MPDATMTTATHLSGCRCVNCIEARLRALRAHPGTPAIVGEFLDAAPNDIAALLKIAKAAERLSAGHSYDCARTSDAANACDCGKVDLDAAIDALAAPEGEDG